LQAKIHFSKCGKTLGVAAERVSKGETCTIVLPAQFMRNVKKNLSFTISIYVDRFSNTVFIRKESTYRSKLFFVEKGDYPWKKKSTTLLKAKWMKVWLR